MTAQRTVRIGNITVGNEQPFVLIGGLNVLENLDLSLSVAEHLKTVCARLAIPLVFKASFDKANRSRGDSFRGTGLETGLRILEEVGRQLQLPLLTDIHTPSQATAAAEVVEVIQIPAFLCRQTDLLEAAALSGCALHIKKAQFLAPEDMAHVLAKCSALDNQRLMLCERGSSFGYHRLVVDMLSFGTMKSFGYPVLFDVTHSLQLPGIQQGSAGGRRDALPELGRAGLIQGLAGLFLEVYPQPEKAPCDGSCALPLAQLEPFLQQMQAVDRLAKSLPPLSVA